MPPAREERPTATAPRATLALAVGAIAFLFACQQIYDPDTWWNLAVGRWILANGAVPTQDVFSFATAGAPWIPHAWLADVAMAWVHSLGGPTALVLLKAALVAAGFVLAFLLTVRNGAAPETTALVLSLAAPIARFQLLERPQVVMFVMVPLFFGLLHQEEAERRRSTWIALAVAALAWTNLHGSFLLGPLLAGALLFERALVRVLPGASAFPGEARGDVARAAGLVALTASLGLVSPFGLDLPLQMVRDITSFAWTRSFAIEEHHALALAEHPGFAALTAVTAASFVAARRVRPFAAAAFLGVTALAFRSVRFAAVAALLQACILPLNLQPFLARLRGARIARARLLAPAPRAAALALVLAAFALVAARATFRAGREARFGVGVNEARFPGPSVRFLASSGFQGNLFNSWVHGGYVLWHLPAARTLVDGRALPAHVALLARLASMDRGALDAWLDDQEVKAALLAPDDPWLPFFQGSPRFVVASLDDRAIVFVRRDHAGAASAHRFLRPGERDPSYLVAIARGPEAREAEAELRRAVAENPGSFVHRFLLGFFLEARGRPEALDAYLAAADLNPGLAFAHYDLGRRAGALALASGQAARAEALLRQALAVKPEDPVLNAMLGSALYAQKDYARAEGRLRYALGRSPDDLLALTNLAYLCTDTRRPGEAATLFRRALAVAPRDENAAYGLAYALQAAGDRAGAAAAWRSFLSAFPESAWASRARQRLREADAP